MIPYLYLYLYLTLWDSNIMANTLDWDPNMTPQIHRLHLGEAEDMVTDLILSSSPTIRLSSIEYKRQLFSSQTLVEHSDVSLAGHNILLQQSRFYDTTQLQYFESFVSRLDLDYELLIKEHLTYSQCQTKCSSHHASMVSTMEHLSTMEKLTNRYQGFSWIATQQATNAKSMYDIDYQVMFSNVSLLPNNNFNTSTTILQGDGYGNLNEINQNKIGSRAMYFDPSGEGKYYPFESYELQTRISNDRHLEFLLPLMQGSNHPRQSYARCVCIRDLAKNRKSQLEANQIVNSTFTDVAGSPTTIELYRLKRSAPESVSNVESILGLQHPSIYKGRRFLTSTDLHPLYLKAKPLTPSNDTIEQGLYVNNDTVQKGLYSPESESRKILMSMDPTFSTFSRGVFKNVSEHKLFNFGKVKRATPVLLSLLGTTVIKAGLASAPYLYSELGSPIESLFQEAKDSLRVSSHLNPKFSNMTSYQAFLDKKYSKSPLTVKSQHDRLEIITNNFMPQLASVSTPDKELALTIQRAAKANLYFKTVIMDDLPKHIIQSLSFSMPYLINQNQPAICNIHHSSTFMLYLCIVEIIHKDKMETSVSLTSLPHKMYSNQFYEFDLLNQEKIQISDLSALQNNEEKRDCIMPLLSNKPQEYGQHCTEVKSGNNIVQRLHKLRKGSLYQVLGTSTITLTCTGKISESLLIEKMVNLVYVSHSCDILVTHGNLRQNFPRLSTLTSDMDYQVILSYDIYNYIGFQQKMRVWIYLISTILLTIVVVISVTGFLLLYVKRVYDPQIVAENAEEEGSLQQVFEPREDKQCPEKNECLDQHTYRGFVRAKNDQRQIPSIYDEIKENTLKKALDVTIEHI